MVSHIIVATQMPRIPPQGAFPFGSHRCPVGGISFQRSNLSTVPGEAVGAIYNGI